MQSTLKHSLTFLFFVALIVQEGFAQKREAAIFQVFQKNEEFNENAFINVGITFNYDHINYFIKKEEPNTFKAITGKSGGSAGIGIPVIFQFNKTFDLYSGVGFNFPLSNPVNSSKGYGISFTDLSELEEIKRHFDNNPEGSNFINMEIPFGLRIRTDAFYFSADNPYSSYRLLLIAGGKFTRHFSANIQAEDLKISPTLSTNPNYLLFKPHFFSWEAGIGVQLKTRYFRLTPQLTFNESLGNLLNTKKYEEWTGNSVKQSPNMEALRSLGIRGFQFKIILE